MQKLENKILQIFLENLKESLEAKNEDRKYDNLTENDRYTIINIPFVMSSLWEAFRAEPNTYSDFVDCLKKSYDYQICICEPNNDYYGICKVIVNFQKESKDYEFIFEDYQYEIEFQYDPRDWGYCQCTPNMEDYREDKRCCGHGCDWWASAFEMRKSYEVGNHSWNGDEHDYWDFEDEFYKSDEELAEKKREEDREREIKELKSRIGSDMKKLKELEGE